MPKLSRDQIKAAITSGRVFAVSIDTTVFDGAQKSFHSLAMRRLDQLRTRGIRVVVADVVSSEMKAHLREDALKSQRALSQALTTHNKRWRRKQSDVERDDLLVDADATALSESEFAAFLDHVGGEVVKASDAPDAVERTFGRYFDKQPPFADSRKRKSEFPDAFALLALESLATSCGKLLMAVSSDGGWADFAAQSQNLFCMPNLDDALGIFNEAEADRELVKAIIERLRERGDLMAVETFSTAFEYCLDDLDFGINVLAGLPFEAEPLSAVAQSIAPENVEEPTVIAADGETVTFTMGVTSCVDFTVAFHFYAADNVDKYEVGLGTVEACVQDTLRFDVTVTAARSMEKGPVLHDVEVAKRTYEIDFGYVNPFTREDPTHEKY